jgi:hypothetical protein
LTQEALKCFGIRKYIMMHLLKACVSGHLSPFGPTAYKLWKMAAPQV